MPSAENHRKIGIPGFHGSSNLHCFADHWTGDKGDAQAKSVLHFFEDALLVVWCDGGVDQADGITSAQEWSGDCQQSQRRRCITAGKRRKEKNDLLRHSRVPCPSTILKLRFEL